MKMFHNQCGDCKRQSFTFSPIKHCLTSRRHKNITSFETRKSIVQSNPEAYNVYREQVNYVNVSGAYRPERRK